MQQRKKTNSRHPTALDGGWGWAVVVASFISHMLLAASYFAYGVFTQAWINEFNSSAALTSMVGSTSSAFASMSAPLGSFIQHRLGCRGCHLIGGIVVSVGVFLSSFATSLVQLFVFYGVMGGIGIGFCYVPSIIVLSEYFKVRRPLALGVASSGIGVGSFIFPFIIEYLQDLYGWRGSMLILSAIMANMVVVAAALFPLSHFDPAKNVSLNHDINRNQRKFALASDETDQQDCFADEPKVFDDLTEKGDLALEEEFKQRIASRERRKSGFSLVRNLVRHPWMRRKSSIAVSVSEMPPPDDVMDVTPHNAMLESVLEKSYEELNASQVNQLTSSYGDVITASRCTIATKISYKKMSFSDQLRFVMKHPLFYLMVVNNLTMFIGMMIVYGLTPSRVVNDFGFSKDQGAVFLSAIGLANLVGRFSWGSITNIFPWINPITFFIWLRIAASALTLLSPLATTFALQMSYSVAVGLAFGAWSLYPLVLAQMFGDRCLGAAFGFLEFFDGVGALVGPTIGGLIFDITHTYHMSFVFGGATLGAGTLVLAIGCYVWRKHLHT